MLVTLSYFQADRFVQLFSLIPIIIFLLYFLISIDLIYAGFFVRLEERKNYCFLS